ncbi:hypothetical protein [Paraburkholderia sp. GAS42]|uniref:hypothetical protein n=1 Tax=Paraburkholderia sp. GAS42 TaxID=3035135 RepID=UPI003D1AF6A0
MRYKIMAWMDPKSGQCEFTQKYGKLGEAGQAKCDERLRYLRDQPPSGWHDPHAKKLDSSRDHDCKDIYEVRFKANGIQHRPMGYFGPAADEFTIVIWATHKGSQYDPSNFCERAKRRWDEHRAGGCTTQEIEID